MKKNYAKIIVLLLILAMVLPQATSAVSLYYVSASVSGPDERGQMQTVTATSTGYSMLSSKLMTEIATAVNPSSYRSILAETFGFVGMHVFFDDCVSALVSGSAAWTAFLTEYGVTSDNTSLMYNYDATLLDLQRAGRTVHAYYGNYVFTVTMTGQYFADTPGEQQPKDTSPIVINGDDSGSPTIQVPGGTVENSNTDPETGDIVRITAIPDDGKIVSYVIVRDENGDKIPVTYDGKGQYYFVMPTSGVQITVKFNPEPADPEISGVSELLETEKHVVFMKGDANGNFRPNDSITRAEVAMIFYRLLKNTDVGELKAFDDVTADKWYADAVGTLAALGILNGVKDGAFEPERPITRGEFAAICARFAKATDSSVQFSDTKGHWAESEISTAAAYGWITGYEDSSFAPDKPITRMEAAAIVNRMLGRMGDQIAIDSGEGVEFPDVDDSLWGWYEIAEATGAHEPDQEDGFVHEYWVE